MKEKLDTAFEHNKLRRFVVLDRLLRNDNGLTLAEMLTDPKMPELISKRTLQNDLKDFEESFKARFAQNLYKGKERLWRYEDTSFSIFQQINNDVQVIQDAIANLNTFKGIPQYDYLRFFLIGLKSGFSDTPTAMSFDFNEEYNNQYLSGVDGTGNLELALNAITRKYPLKVVYKPFNSEKFTDNLHPYHLRQYNNRWFLFGHSENRGCLVNYALDRMVSMAYLNKEYRPCDIDFQNYFDEIVGVTNYENKAVQKLLLRVTKTRIDYLRTKPLHWSQKELKNKETDDHVFLELSLKPNKELEMLLLSYGPDIEVLEPADYRHLLANLVKTMYRKYEV